MPQCCILKTRDPEAFTRMSFFSFLSLQWHHWFLCEELGPVTKLSKNGECCFRKGKWSWGPSPQPWAIEFLWLEVFAFARFFGGNFQPSANNDLALCYDDIYDHTFARVGTKRGSPFWTPSGVKKVPLLVQSPKQIIILIFIPLNFFRP